MRVPGRVVYNPAEPNDFAEAGAGAGAQQPLYAVARSVAEKAWPEPDYAIPVPRNLNAGGFRLSNTESSATETSA